MEDNIKKISSDLEEYRIIADYYKENPLRREPDNAYLLNISDELLDISYEQLPKETHNLCMELFKFFGEISDYL